MIGESNQKGSHYLEKINQKYRIQIVEDLDKFQKLETTWDGLLENQKYHIPFLCFDWFKVWLEHFLKDNKLFILVVYDGNRVAGIAPFIIRHEKFRRIIPTKKIELIGNFDSHIRNFILGNPSDGERSEILSALFDYLRDQHKNWDVIELESMPEEDPTYNTLKSIIAEHAFKNKEFTCFGDWYLDGINYSGDEYIKRRSKNTRSGVGKKRRRIERLGHLEFQVGTEKEKLDYYLSLYQEVRGKSWKHPELNRAFLNDARHMAAEKQCLKFGFLFFNNSPIATLFTIISNGTAYLMEVVYDKQYEEFSPGEIIYAEFIKYLIDVDRITEIDQLRGDEPYKKSWTPQRRERKGIQVFNSNFKGRFLSFLITKMLPIVEKNQHVLSVKKKLSGYLKKHGGSLTSD